MAGADGAPERPKGNQESVSLQCVLCRVRPCFDCQESGKGFFAWRRRSTSDSDPSRYAAQQFGGQPQIPLKTMQRMREIFACEASICVLNEVFVTIGGAEIAPEPTSRTEEPYRPAVASAMKKRKGRIVKRPHGHSPNRHTRGEHTGVTVNTLKPYARTRTSPRDKSDRDVVASRLCVTRVA